MIDPTLVGTIFLLFLSLLGLSWFAGKDAPYVPTAMSQIHRVLKISGVKKGKVFYELGSGDGRVVYEAALMGATANGIEQSWIRVWYSRYKARKLNLKRTYFYHGDLFRRHYYPADIVYVYLLRPAVNQLEKKLDAELKKGAVIITQTFHFKSWKPFKKDGDFWFYRKA